MSEQVKGISERAPEPPYMDFPEAWAFVRTTKLEDHHMRCSWRSGVLCDCNVLWAEYYKRKAARSEQVLAALENRATTALAAGNQPRSAQPNNLAEAETHHD